MTTPRDIPNPATRTVPTRSSQRVAHKKPLRWLPWAVLLLLAALIALVIYAATEANESKTAAVPAPAATPASSSAAAAAPAPAPAATTNPAGSGGAFDQAVAASGALVGGGGTAPAAANTGNGSAVTARRTAGTAGTVLFAEGSAAIDNNGQQVITTAAANLKRAHATQVDVFGYTDVIAGTPVNAPLSKQRAAAVAVALRALLPGVTVTPSAKGQADPIAPNSTRQGRAQNRRAAIVGTG